MTLTLRGLTSAGLRHSTNNSPCISIIGGRKQVSAAQDRLTDPHDALSYAQTSQ